ncbi:hypothetical protein ES703_82841 [subsurface metagenome]
MVGGELEDAVAEPDLFRPLACGGKEGFRRRRVRVFLKEVMLDHPGIIVARPVRDLELGQGVLVKPEFIAFLPGARQLQLIEDTELHDVSPAICPVLVERSLVPRGLLSSETQFRCAGEGLAVNRETTRGAPRHPCLLPRTDRGGDQRPLQWASPIWIDSNQPPEKIRSYCSNRQRRHDIPLI